jgi:acetoin utilization protein AcuB
MAKSTPQLRKYMTPSPHAIGDDQTLATAHKMMRENRIRHLPVLHAGKLKGIVSQRDLAFIEMLQGVDPEKVTVEDAMSTDVFTAEPNEPLEEVVTSMAEHKYGCCVIMDAPKVAGIFTTIDACRALAAVLHKKS